MKTVVDPEHWLRPRTAELRKRPRRLRTGATMRALVREHEVRLASLVQPLFVADDGQQHALSAGEVHLVQD